MLKIKNILIALASVCMMTTACDWTEYEPIDFTRQSKEESDPEGYAQYLSNVKEFKSSEHPICIGSIVACSDRLSSQSQHLMAMPDSMDYIIVKNSFEMNDVQKAEVNEVREKKGTKSLAYLDIDVIRQAFDKYSESLVESGKPALTEQDLPDFVKKSAEEFFANEQINLFDGVVVSALGAGDEIISLIKTSVDWFASHPDKISIFRGSILNFTDSDNDYLKDCSYIVVVMTDHETTTGSINLAVSRLVANTVAKDRVLAEVTVPSELKPDQVGPTPQAAAQWAVESAAHKKFNAKGIVIDNAYDDYFCPDDSFANVRKAIEIMNSDIIEK